MTSWMNNLDFRFNGSVPIKGGFTGSFIFRNTRGRDGERDIDGHGGERHVRQRRLQERPRLEHADGAASR